MNRIGKTVAKEKLEWIEERAPAGEEHAALTTEKYVCLNKQPKETFMKVNWTTQLYVCVKATGYNACLLCYQANTTLYHVDLSGCL